MKTDNHHTYFVEGLLECCKFVGERLGVEHVHQIEDIRLNEENNLDANEVVPIINAYDKKELTNNEEVIVHHG